MLSRHILHAALFFSLSFPTLCSAQKPIADESIVDIPQGIFGYIESVGGKTKPFNWQAEAENDNITVTVKEDDKLFYNLCAFNGDTLKWRIKVEDKHDITATRNDNTINIEGIRFGEPYQKSVEIDDRPWYQPLSFSLRSFLSSDEEKISFWVVRADKIEIVALTAKKLGVENISLDGSEVPAQKIEIRAEGFYSSFWHATYWYRQSDNLFLRYQSVHGLPGTAETIVELVELPDELSSADS